MPGRRHYSQIHGYSNTCTTGLTMVLTIQRDSVYRNSGV
jgi:hypothetical protein